MKWATQLVYIKRFSASDVSKNTALHSDYTALGHSHQIVPIKKSLLHFCTKCDFLAYPAAVAVD